MFHARASVAAIRDVLDPILSHRPPAPSQDVTINAAVRAGTSRAACRVARVRALHDGTLVLQARRLGCALPTANVADLDCLQRIGPEGRVLFWEAA